MSADGAFFAEWSRRGPGERRSLDRARALAERLGIDPAGRPVLTVVGSKGKGTAAAYASARLAAAGLRTVTVTSPAYRDNRERIRLDGAAVSAERLAALAARLDAACRGLPPRRRHGGYLSPAGLFTLAGALFAQLEQADVLVAEAGMGGRSDEVSLLPPAVVAIGPVFAEHIGVLGDSTVEIAREKAAVAAPSTRAVLTVPQPPEIARAVRETVAERTGGAVVPAEVGPGSSGLAPELLPAGLAAASAELGTAAAARLPAAEGRPPVREARLRAVLATLRLPGRLSWHRVPGGSTELLADSAIDRRGAASALAAALDRWSSIDHVLLCLPDHKDLDGVAAELAGLPVTFVRLPYRHLRFTRALPPGWRVVDADDLGPESLAALGQRVVALGTVYFVGRMLDLVGAATDPLFRP
ncbi:hypothetical protein [Allonocardiopsis opalescens]|uniref:Dihydrofolate synthase/folylpolyglutamate synthase n=1 Tax=Allonocardiopsis opalescens TaxID=1144618 RepID=A0A2T0PXX3_9ACTN|nr:hypothetical protein [Allonocardiopsis opalescens]PRX96373.1 dihydrofolate synthase/folylpolyglutamate synthase [Allonocardiopsis opalescens]